MNTEVKKLWVDALRSGEYKQCQGTLIKYSTELSDAEIPTEEELKNASYCCLGVLCDVYRKQTGENLWKNMAFDNSLGVLPDKVIEWADLGLDNRCPHIDIHEGKRSLTVLNDKLKLDFNRIGDLIDKNL